MGPPPFLFCISIFIYGFILLVNSGDWKIHDRLFRHYLRINILTHDLAYFIQNWESYIIHKRWKVLFVALTNNNWHVFWKTFCNLIYNLTCFFSILKVTQRDGVRATQKKLPQFFFQNPFLWAMGQKNMNCGKIFLPYGITPLSLLKSPIFTMKKKLKYFLLIIRFYGILSCFAPSDTTWAS